MARDACRLARYGGLAELRSLSPHAVDGLLYYAVTPEGEPAGVLPVLVDVSDAATLAAWTAAMEAHGSQLKTRRYVDSQLTRARLLGLRAGVEHAVALYPNDPLVVTGLAAVARAARRF